MKEVEFRDRVPTHPGRYRITHVSGNLYDMERMDEPTEPGTALNKVAFDSIIHSRLTGRYYKPTVVKAVAASTTLTTNPVPASGWAETGTEKATNGLYVATASPSQENPAEAFDGTWSTNSGWRPSFDDDEPWIAIDFGSPIVLTKIKTYFVADARVTTCVLSGSNDGVNWYPLAEVNETQTKATEWSFENTTAYRHYRLSFNNTGIRLYGWEFTEYVVTTYRNVFTISIGWPTSFESGQVALVEIPSNVATLGVVSNTINGITVNTILQPNKRYELRYTGSAFAAKEV